MNFMMTTQYFSFETSRGTCPRAVNKNYIAVKSGTCLQLLLHTLCARQSNTSPQMKVHTNSRKPKICCMYSRLRWN